MLEKNSKYAKQMLAGGAEGAYGWSFKAEIGNPAGNPPAFVLIFFFLSNLKFRNWVLRI